ncbi:MAG: ABC transporter permease [Gaiellales bacterium]
MSDGRIWPVASAIAWRTTRNAFRSRAVLLPMFLFPLFFLTAFAGGLSQIRELPGFDYPGDYLGFQFAFVLLQAGAFGGVFTGFSVARDFESGIAKRLLLAAPNRVGIVIGYALAALLRWALVASVLTVVSLLVGMEVGGTLPDIVGMYTLAALLNVAAFMWSCGIAMRLRTVQAGPLMQMPVFLILFFAPVYVPLELLRGWIHGVARVNPVTYVLEAARSLLAGDPVGVATAFLVGLCFAAVLSVWALRGLRRAEAAG